MTHHPFAALPIGTRFRDERGLMWLKLAASAAQCIDAASEEHGVSRDTVQYFAPDADVYTA